MNKIGLLTVAGLSGLAVPVLATSASTSFDEYRFHKRLYIGAGTGVTTVDPDTSEANGFDVIDSEDTGSHFFAGYDFSRRLTFELQYADLGTSLLSQNAEIDYQEVSLSGLYYPVSYTHLTLPTICSV